MSHSTHSETKFARLCGRGLRLGGFAAGFFLVFLSPLRAETTPSVTVVLPHDLTKLDLTPYLSVARDKTAQLTVEDIRKLPPTDFHDVIGRWPNFGFTSDAIWLRFSVQSASPHTDDYLIELGTARLDHIHWYVYRGGALIFTAVGGDLERTDAAKRDFRHPVMKLRVGPGEALDVYVQIRSRTSLSVPVTLWDPETYGQVMSHLEWRSGMYFGYLAAMVAIGLCFAFANRDRIFLLYSLMNASFWMLFFCLGGYYSWLGWAGVHFWSHHGLLLCLAGCTISMLLLLRYIFAIARSFPHFDRFFRIFLAVTSVILLVGALGPYQPVIIMVLCAEMVICVVVAAGSWYLFFRIYKLHPLYFLGWLVLWTFAFLVFLKPFAVVPIWTTAEEDMRGVVGYGALLFLFALATRARKVRRENESIRQRALEQQQQMNVRLEQEVREQTKELLIAKNQAEAANRSKSLFLANMSHEIRAPLSSLVGLSQAMCLQSDKYKLPEEFTRFLEQIRVGGQYLNMMLTNLLDVSAAEAGRTPLHWRVIRLAEWMESVRNLLEPAALNHGVQLAWKLDLAPSLEIETDPIRLTQILLNLIHNAVKFSPSGATVEITFAQVDESLKMAILDSGPGIAAGEMQAIFEAFAQGGSQAERGTHGAGLGLAVVRKNAELLHGGVTVENRDCGGACFTVTLPLRR